MPNFLARTFAVLLTALCLHAASAAERIAAGPLQQGPIRFDFAIYLPDASREPQAMPALRERLKDTGMPVLVAAPPDKPTGASVAARSLSTVQQDYRPPSPELLRRFGRGLSLAQVEALQRTQHALVLSFTYPLGRASLQSYQAALLLAEQVARDTQGLLWDEETREVFTPDAWRERRIDTWWGGLPDVSKQTVIHAYKGDRQVRAITLGMAKFGLPDLVVDDFSWSNNTPMGNLLLSLSQAMVEGAQPKTAGQYELDLRALRHARVKEGQLSGLLANAKGSAQLALVKGRPEEGDPDNRLVEVEFDRYRGPDRYARQTALLNTLFGSSDPVTWVKHDQALLEASAAARAKLPALRDAFRKGLAPGEYILLKLPFEAPDGGREWMWVEVAGWDGDTITGQLNNEPARIPALHAGQTVKGSQSKVFDYLRRFADGREEGNETGRILEKMKQQPAPR